MPLIDIREHGGVFGGGGGGVERFVNVTASLTPPANPNLYDIWIKTNEQINDIYFEEIQPALSSGQAFIMLGGKKTVRKVGNYQKANKHITIPTDSVPQSQNLIFESKFLDLYATLMLAKFHNGNDVVLLEAYYWDGTSWKMFSNADALLFFMLTKASNMSVASLNVINNQMIAKTADKNLINALFALDKRQRMIYTQQPYVDGKQGFAKYDYQLNFLGVVGAGVGKIHESSKPYFADNGILFYIDYNTGNLIVYDTNADAIIRTIAPSGYTNVIEIFDIDPFTNRVAFNSRPPGVSDDRTYLYDYSTGTMLTWLSGYRRVKLIPNSQEGYVFDTVSGFIKKFRNNLFSDIVYSLAGVNGGFYVSRDGQYFYHQAYSSTVGGYQFRKTDVQTGQNTIFLSNELKNILGSSSAYYGTLVEDAIGDIFGVYSYDIYKHSATDGSLILKIPRTSLADGTYSVQNKIDTL
jgi:hypothetical protein